MYRSYQYQLKPTPGQDRVLRSWLRINCELYNAALQERRDAWAKQKVKVGKYDQQLQLKDIRFDRPDLCTVPVAALRGTLNRLDKAYTAFFRRCKAGDKPGYPRFKSARRWDTLEFENQPGKGFICANGKRIHIVGLGKVKIRLHRPLGGVPCTLKVSICGDRQWRVSISCEDVPAQPLPATGQTVGIDLGLSTFVATSDGELYDNPRPMRSARVALERAQRRVTKRKIGSHRRRKAAALLRKQHVRVARVRREHHIKVARQLVQRYDIVYVEKLNIAGLAKSCLSKSISDAGWSIFLHWLSVKAESAGRTVVQVDPAYTTQTCSGCGAVAKKTLAERAHRCPCGVVLDRDINAAINIKNKGAGLALRREAAVPIAPRRPEKRAKE